jgi:hypothetical protein
MIWWEYGHGRHEKCINFYSEKQKGRDHLKNLDIDGKMEVMEL